MRDTFIKKLSEMCSTDPKILLVTGDLGFGVFDDFRKQFPDQFINAGIAEQNMMGLATGLAMEGYKVFTYSIGNFPTLRCLEQLRNDTIYHDANVTVVSIGGGFSYGALGMSHHATEDLSILRALPFDVAVPNNLFEVEKLTEYFVKTPKPSFLRLDKSNAEYDKNVQPNFRYGGVVELKAGNDITIISLGGITQECINASVELEKQNISCRILAAHSIRPFDFTLVEKAIRETKGLISVEENTVDGGFGGFLAENLLERGLVPNIFKRIGLRNGFSSVVGDQKYLRNYYNIDKNAICDYVLSLKGDNKI